MDVSPLTCTYKMEGLKGTCPVSKDKVARNVK
uniref:Uncharacterized protein n=1 Tax=Anguilla anguilla TaxID=7936 RepID=A0A0E9XS00_ANGAN